MPTKTNVSRPTELKLNPFIITFRTMIKNHLAGTILEIICIGFGIFSIGNIKPLNKIVGIIKSSVLDPIAAGKNLVMSIDVQGVESLRRAARRDARLHRAMSTIFIVVDHERLVARMHERAKDLDDEIARRLATAEAELREAAKFDVTIESRTRDEDFAALLAIVAKARARA